MACATRLCASELKGHDWCATREGSLCLPSIAAACTVCGTSTSQQFHQKRQAYPGVMDADEVPTFWGVSVPATGKTVPFVPPPSEAKLHVSQVMIAWYLQLFNAHWQAINRMPALNRIFTYMRRLDGGGHRRCCTARPFLSFFRTNRCTWTWRCAHAGGSGARRKGQCTVVCEGEGSGGLATGER